MNSTTIIRQKRSSDSIGDCRDVKNEGHSKDLMPVYEKPNNRFFKAIHNLLLPLVLSDTSNKLIVQFQKIAGLTPDGKVKDKFLYHWFKFSAACGEESFALMPLAVWLYFPLAPALITNFGLVLLCGQINKELFMLPRPLTHSVKHPVIKLEVTFDTEHGFPSTHTMVGFLPFTILLRLSRVGIECAPTVWLSALFMLVSIIGSRLYLGVHSLVDICGGILFGSLMTVLLHVYGDSVDSVLYGSTIPGLYILAAMLFCFSTFYPRAAPWTAGYGTSSAIFGTFFGSALGFQYIFNHDTSLRNELFQRSILSLPVSFCRNAQNGLFSFCEDIVGANSSSSSSLISGEASTAFLSLVRVASVAIPTVLLLFLVKHVTSSSLTSLVKSGAISISSNQLVDIHGREVPTKKAYAVEIPTRLITYGATGLFITIAPIFIWRALGI